MCNEKHIITKKNFLLLTVALFCFPLIGTEEPLYEKIVTLIPTKTLLLSNINTRGLPLDVFSYINACVTPNEKAVILSYNGAVYKNNITPFFHHKETTVSLFKHTSARLTSLLTTDETKDGALLIVSGGNYFNKKEKQLKSEIVTYNSKSQSHTFKEYNWPLQALKLSHKGTLLLAATPSHVLLFNLSKETQHSIEFEPSSKYCNHPDQKIVDIDIAYNGDDAYSDVIVIGNYGVIELMKINAEQTGLTFSRKLTVGDNLTQLTLATPRTMLCTTDKNKVKTIDMLDFQKVENSTRATFFAQSVKWEHVTLDPFSLTSAYWTTNQSYTNGERSIILINRVTNPKSSTHDDPEEDKIQPNREHYRLSASFDEPTYPIILPNAKSAECKSHFLSVTLRKSTVIAIASTGQQFVWKLPQIESPHITDKKELSTIVEKPSTKPSTRPSARRASLHEPSSRDRITTTTSTSDPSLNRGEKKAPSPRLTTLVIKTAGSRSNSTSPREPKESPTHTPTLTDSPKKTAPGFQQAFRNSEGQ